MNELILKFAPETPEQKDVCDKITAELKQTTKYILDNCPNSREKSLALTNLEQANMWALASIVRNV